MKSSECLKQKTHYYNLDFCRFVFVLLIVNFHNFLHEDTLYKRFSDIDFYQKMHQMSSRAYIFVEFFFILSGFFLAHTFFTKKELTFSEFVKQKIVRLWPMLFFSLLCYYITSLFQWGTFNFYNDVLHLLFLQSVGMELSWVNNGPAWFLSSLFWNSIFIFYLLKNYTLKNVNLFLAVAGMISLAAMVQFGQGSIAAIGPKTMINNLLPTPFLRGFIGISLGYFLYCFISPYQKKQQDTKIKKIGFTSLEIFLFVFLVYYTSMNTFPFNNDVFLLFVIFCLIALFLLEKGCFSKLLNNKKMLYFGNFSFSIYMLQEIAFRFTDHVIFPYKSFVHNHFIFIWLVSTLIVIFFGIVGDIIVNKGMNLIKKYLF